MGRSTDQTAMGLHRMIVCNGRGDGGGGHCCWIDGKVCEFLFTDRGGTPRCMVWDKMDTGRWRNSPVGQWFEEHHPGYTCRDWPQNIPELMQREPEMGPFSLCCWGRGNA